MKKAVKIIILFILTIALSIIGYVLVHSGKHNYDLYKLTSTENSSVDYKVFLKENKFFETPYLEKDRTYIASLIDYIDLTVNYNARFNDKVNGSYTYYTKAVVNANKTNSEDNYYSKEFILSEEKKVEIKDGKNIDLSENIKLNYQEYNDILTSFKEEYGVSMDGQLVAYLVIKENLENDNMTRGISKEVSIPISVPLTQLTVDVSVKTDNLKNKTELFETKIEKKDNKYIIFKAIGYVSFAASVLVIIYLIIIGIIKVKKESEYRKKLRKILKVYDSIIVSVKNHPSIEDLNIIEVTSFEELIDAHSEVRKPINFYEYKKGAAFTLLNEGNVWLFRLKRNENEEE